MDVKNFLFGIILIDWQNELFLRSPARPAYMYAYYLCILYYISLRPGIDEVHACILCSIRLEICVMYTA